MDILRVKDDQGQWRDVPALVGPQGETGPQGPAGRDGADGVSPTASVEQTASGATITVTDAQGTTTANLANGQDGQDGSPGADGTDGQSAYVWIRYASAQPTQDSDMKTTPDAWMGIYSGDSATAPTAYTAYTWYNIKGQTGPVSDVQVNGVSVLNQGVANVPVADGNAVGVVGINPSFGIGIYDDQLIINGANSDNIKAGNNSAKPISPLRQHESTFYGFAKAAGADMAFSSNPVGTYTDAAKVAIQKMLGLYKAPYRKIKEITITESTSKYHVTTDQNGDSFALSDVLVFFKSVVSDAVGNTVISVNSGNAISGNIPKIYVKNASNTSAQTRTIHLWTDGGKFFSMATDVHMASNYNFSAFDISRDSYGIFDCELINELCIQSANLYNFTSGTIEIYGR